MLELENVHTHYGKSHVLHGISMHVDDGEIVGLFGRNGAGKTTTLRSITGMQPPSEGRIRFQGEDITGADVTTIARKGIRIVLEDRRPFPDLTVGENLELSVDTQFGSEWTIDRALEVLPRLEERYDQKADHLSGGERQMLVIAQALVANPNLVLLDEPMEGLAPQIVDDIVDIIRQINDAGMPILLVEQSFDVCLELIDHGYLIHKGEIKLEGGRDRFESETAAIEQYLGVNV